MNELSETGPVLIVSPHLDDAVLSCAQLIKSRDGTTVMTVLAGFPSGAHAGWSAVTTGLPVAKDANLKRREEDSDASRALGAQTVWLDILAQEYGPVATPSERRQQIQEAFVTAVASTRARSVFVPLGVTHPDHVLVSEATLPSVLASDLELYLYMDMPYGQARPSHVRRRLRHIRRTYKVDPLAPFYGDLRAKAEAVNAYSSQIATLQQGFGGHFEHVFVDPETFWRVRPLA